MAERVRQILEDYNPAAYKEQYLAAFQLIKTGSIRLSPRKLASLGRGAVCPRNTVALEHYYDPKYNHSFSQYEGTTPIVVAVDRVEEAVDAVKDILRTQMREDRRVRMHYKRKNALQT